MPWKLKDLDSTTIIDLQSGDILGRSEGNHKFPECEKMSRSHCQFVLERNIPHFMDLGSRNGIVINSQKCEPNVKIPVEDGQILMFGGKTFMLKGSNEDKTQTDIPIPRRRTK